MWAAERVNKDVDTLTVVDCEHGVNGVAVEGGTADIPFEVETNSSKYTYLSSLFSGKRPKKAV